MIGVLLVLAAVVWLVGGGPEELQRSASDWDELDDLEDDEVN